MSKVLSFLALLLRAGYLIAALFCAGIALAAQGGRFSSRLDALTHLTPFWMLAGVLCALLAALMTPEKGRALPLALGCVTLLSGLLLMAPDLLAGNGKPAVRGPDAIKIIQFNAWYQNEDPDGSVAWILSQDPDFVILEEAKGEARQVQTALRDRYPYRITCGGLTRCATMILSKKKPVAYRGLQTMDDHPPVPAAWAQFRDRHGLYTIAGVHLAWPTTPGGVQKIQLGRLNRVLAEVPNDRLILTGDFNSTPWSFTLKRQDRRLGITRRTRGLASFPARKTPPIPFRFPFPVLPIDHVYAGEGWKTVSISRGPRLGSDHYPIVAVLTPASAAPSGPAPGGR